MPTWARFKTQLTAEAQKEKWVINNSIALWKYYQVSKNKWVELESHYAAKNWRDVYICAKKFLHLTNTCMPRHRSYANRSQADKREKLLKLKQAAMAYLETSAGELEYLCDQMPQASPSDPEFLRSITNDDTCVAAPERAQPAARSAPAPARAAPASHRAAPEDDPEVQRLMARLAGLDSTSRAVSPDLGVRVEHVAPVVPTTAQYSATVAQDAHQIHNEHQQYEDYHPRAARGVVVQPAVPTMETGGTAPTARDLARLARQNGGWGGVGSVATTSSSAPLVHAQARGSHAQNDGAALAASYAHRNSVSSDASTLAPASSEYSPAMLADLAKGNGRWRGVNIGPIVMRARSASSFPASGGASGGAIPRARVVVPRSSEMVRVQARPVKTYDHVHPDLRNHAIDQDFRSELADCGAIVVECAKDGNCLFRAISCQLYGYPDRHAEIRLQAVRYMRTQPERFKWLVDPPTAKQLDTYLRAREQPVRGTVGEWGDHPEILALEEVFDRPIEIYSHEHGPRAPRKTHMTELPEELKDVTPFRLSFHGANHYNALTMPRPGDSERPPLAPRRTRYLQRFRSS